MRFLVFAVLAGLPVAAQWKLPPSTVKADAPVPRVQGGPADGKPDLSGIWEQTAMTHFRNLMADLKPEDYPYKPETKAIIDARTDGAQGLVEPDANCLPQGVPKINAAPVPFKIVQTPKLIVLVYEAFNLWRQVHMDGRQLDDDPSPTWLGYSVGRWEGDTLVVETRGFNGKAWLDTAGRPASDALHVTEKFRRTSMGTMDLEITIEDPKMYTRPWTAKEKLRWVPNTEVMEFICLENEKDLKHMGNNMRTFVIAAFLLATSLSAQWIKYPTKGIPRNPDGSPNLTAPAPRIQGGPADGKPDLSGLWQTFQGFRYTVNLAADLKPEEVPQLLPAAAAEYKRRQDTISKDDPVGYCNLPGIPQANAIPYPFKIIQTAGQTTILYEAIRTFREIFTDGRGFPEDMQPNWLGYSIGRWEGDVFVVETAGQNDKTWVDTGGRPHTEQLRVTEKFRRRNFGTIDLETTINDPGAYTKPWTVKYELRLQPDTELIEYVCTENNKDIQHLVGK